MTSEPAVGARPTAPASGARWLVLAAFTLCVSATQLLWLTFAPVTAETARALGITEGSVGDLAAINPLGYVLLAIPTGRWLDRRFGLALATGALLTAAGGLVRAFAATTFAVVLLGQVLFSAGQPLVVNATTKIAARHFPAHEQARAIAVGSAGQFVGILLAATTGTLLVDRGGLPLLVRVHAGYAVVAGLLLLLALRVPAAYETEATAIGSLGWLRREPVLWRLAGLLFVGIGVFNATATWLDAILSHLGHPGTAGTLIAVMTVAGIAGAAVLPDLAARRDRRRDALLLAIGLLGVAFLALTLVNGPLPAGVVMAVLGFALLACLPIALDWSELVSGPERASTATGFLLLAGNLGGVLLVLVVQAVIGNPYAALLVLAATAIPGVLLARGLPRTAPRRAPAPVHQSP